MINDLELIPIQKINRNLARVAQPKSDCQGNRFLNSELAASSNNLLRLTYFPVCIRSFLFLD